MSSPKKLCLRSNALLFKSRIDSLKSQSLSERIGDDMTSIKRQKTCLSSESADNLTTIVVKSEESLIKTEELKVETEDLKIKIEDFKVKTEDLKIKTEDIKVKTEDFKVKTENLYSIKEERLDSSIDFQRQSFSERICDDLCESILQYLSLEDKLRLECVSKQFQRTIFEKQYELTIDVTDESESIFFRNHSFNLKNSESLLKKCPNITSVELEYNHWDQDFRCNNYNKFIILITKYCNNLVEFRSPSPEMSVSAYNGFLKKFGSKLKAFKPLNDFMEFPNLEELPLHWILTNQLELITKLKFDKLTKLNCTIDDEEEGEEALVSSLIENCPSIRYLDLIFLIQNLNMVLKSIPKLKDLIHLSIKRNKNYRIGYDLPLSDEIYSDSVKEIARNCPKLKSFQSFVTLINFTADGFTYRQSLSTLKAFKQLKRLTLVVNGSEYFHDKFSMSAFEGLSNLTHLTLCFHRSFELKTNRLIDIDIYLPNLQCLALHNVWGREGQQSLNILADILNRLLNLRKLHIFSYFGDFCANIERIITEKCVHIKNLHIKYESNRSTLPKLLKK